jgi:hypothetical protein
VPAGPPCGATVKAAASIGTRAALSVGSRGSLVLAAALSPAEAAVAVRAWRLRQLL